MAHLVQIQRLSKTYHQGNVAVDALRGIDLTVRALEFTAICGPSGSGKTTLLNVMGALDDASSGTISVDGHDLGSLSPHGKAQLRLFRIGFVFQAYNLIPVLTAYENAEYVMVLQGVSSPVRRSRLKQIFRELDLQGLERRLPFELSGGQQQRVAVARAVAARPALVLADEPTANLDSKSGASLLDMMEKLNREHGVTFIFSTHDWMVMERARRLVLLKDGMVEEDRHKDEGGRRGIHDPMLSYDDMGRAGILAAKEMKNHMDPPQSQHTL